MPIANQIWIQVWRWMGTHLFPCNPPSRYSALLVWVPSTCRWTQQVSTKSFGTRKTLVNKRSMVQVGDDDCLYVCCWHVSPLPLSSDQNQMRRPRWGWHAPNFAFHWLDLWEHEALACHFVEALEREKTAAERSTVLTNMLAATIQSLHATVFIQKVKLFLSQIKFRCGRVVSHRELQGVDYCWCCMVCLTMIVFGYLCDDGCCYHRRWFFVAVFYVYNFKNSLTVVITRRLVWYPSFLCRAVTFARSILSFRVRMILKAESVLYSVQVSS